MSQTKLTKWYQSKKAAFVWYVQVLNKIYKVQDTIGLPLKMKGKLYWRGAPNIYEVEKMARTAIYEVSTDDVPVTVKKGFAYYLTIADNRRKNNYSPLSLA